MVDGMPDCSTGATYLVGDTVWLDGDGNGMQDSGEAGIAGVTMELHDANGNLVDTAVTGRHLVAAVGQLRGRQHRSRHRTASTASASPTRATTR